MKEESIMHAHVPQPFLRRGFAVPILVVLLIAAAACGSGEDPAIAKAKQVFGETMRAKPEYAGYGLSVAAGSRSPFVRQILLEMIASDHYATALEAVRVLQDDPPPEAREVLQGVFQQKRGALKLQAAVALARLGDADALEWLKTEISGGGAALSLPAVKVLAEHDEVEAVEAPVRAYMASDSLDTRNEAYAALGEIGQPWATSLLLEGLDNELGEDRQQAITALGRTGDAEVARKIVRFHNTQGLVFATLEALGALGNPDSAPAAEAMVAHEEKTVRVYAAAALWRLGDAEKAVPVLEPLLEDEDPMLRDLLAEQLAPIEAPQAREWLARLAADPDKQVRLSALRSLAAEPSAEDVPVFLRATGDEDYEVATVALGALAMLGLPAENKAQIEPLLDSDNPYVALSAANALLTLETGGGGEAG
jgi:HEAT repeat protein